MPTLDHRQNYWVLLLWTSVIGELLVVVDSYSFIEFYGNDVIQRNVNGFQKKTYIDLNNPLPSGAVIRCHAFTATVNNGPSDVIHFGIWEKVTPVQFKLLYSHRFSLVNGQSNISFVPDYFYAPQGSYMGLTFEQFPGGILFDYANPFSGSKFGFSATHVVMPTVNSLVNIIFSSFFVTPSFRVEFDLRIPGRTGETGMRGQVGATGPQGVQGVAGPIGVTGPMGPIPTDVDECTLNTYSCPTNSFCLNTFGGYVCQCNPGYRLQPDGNCSNIDECMEMNGVCEHNCTDTDGSMYCTCWDGYQLSDNLHSCLDINECLNASACASGRCYNSPGSYECVVLSLGLRPARIHGVDYSWNVRKKNSTADSRDREIVNTNAAMIMWMTLISIAVIILVLMNIRQFVKNRYLRKYNRTLRRTAEEQSAPEVRQNGSVDSEAVGLGAVSFGPGYSY